MERQMNWTYTLLFLLLQLTAISQTLDPTRAVDWSLAGLRTTASNHNFIEIDMQSQGAIGDGVTPNDAVIADVIATITGPGAILIFPAGEYLFNSTINLSSNIILKGQGADQTLFKMDSGGTGNSINIIGGVISADTSPLIAAAVKDDNSIIISDASSFAIGNWVQIIQDDSDLVSSAWAANSVGQIIKIKNISNNTLELESPIRLDFDLSRSPYIVKINPIENVGIECLKIKRLDNTAPQQSTNISFTFAVNCWVKGIASENCTFSHLQASRSSNLYISNSYFHHAFSYGGGGRAYGVTLQSTTNECLVENNIFEHLRHSMILQSGANGNVFAYNYSFDPFWDSDPSDAAGDMVLHGNYPFANLFEQNICSTIVIDNSHGPNGPHNTVFRNRATLFGIFFSENNSPAQNLLGNEIPNINDPYDQYNYTIQGGGHFIFGNNNKGIIHPSGTNALSDLSYAYIDRPDFIPANQWAGIGTPNVMETGFIPAYDRYNSGNIFSNTCGNSTSVLEQDLKSKAIIFPNPVQSTLSVESPNYIKEMKILNSLGQEIYSKQDIGKATYINTATWQNGVYIIVLQFSGNESSLQRIIKNNSF